ncbi:MAG: protein kinase [Planctomycetales bacterium]|nr:protein kinase [Planctomycetales bacterium]NIM09404.1 protein kinase [Planctomycetales bacterium]NIN08878.1 protein kinase [Planctomycetales bacterium]NIN77993.1 protein kinase [Planctomycetales bacterium]NIO35176.1 protein kinase [Planctomycetales bacterium]
MDVQQLGPYKIGACLGQGGMGTVYAAVETASGQPAAIKVLAPQLAANEGFRERFEAEIDSLKQLKHPHIVRLYGYGQEDHYVYYAMELVDGCSLEDELRQGRRFDWREVADIGIGVCRALKLAHDHGIIHRDIKPANLLWSKDEVVKLTDFGIARLFGNTGLTSEGGVLGTAEYMAPEQADGRRVTHHCDLYSLGGVLYALLAGRPPFRSKSMLEMLQMQRYSQPEPVRRYAPDAPEELEQIISQLLEKDPRDRFPNALMVARRLEAMERALSLREEKTKSDPHMNSTDQADQGSFTLKTDQHPEGGQPAADAAPLGMTIDADAAADEPAPTSVQEPEPAAVVLPKKLDQTQEHAPELTSDVLQHQTTFTTMEEERRAAEMRQHSPNPLVAGPTWLLIAGLLATALLAYWFMQPPTPQSLYQQIVAAAEEDDRALLAAADEVANFLKHYPDHPRAAEIEKYQDRIDMLRLARTARIRARNLQRQYPDSPIAAEYLAAIELAEIDPDLAAARLQALIHLYQVARQEDIRVFVEAAREQLPRIRDKIQQRAASQLAWIRQRLDHANAIAASHPDQARGICEAIMDMYSDRPWAAPVIDEAQRQLDDLKSTAAEQAP